jgi:ppGpp synthetase/RelA/SpoT-type nucleotidyltranferase
VSALPISRNQLDKLGNRLAADGGPSDTDLELLLDVLSAYQAALDDVQVRLGHLGYQPTTRAKTTAVLIDKLRREHSRLNSVQDIAGARIVSDCNRMEQDEIVRAVVALFDDGTKPPRVKDRRQEPSSGYRAVHVVVTVQGLPVEIQVRTQRQDRWAQIVEALGDKWGRGIRYGETPPDPDSPFADGVTVTRRQLWEIVRKLSDLIDAAEQYQARANQLTYVHHQWDQEGVLTEEADAARQALKQDVEDLTVQLLATERELSLSLDAIASVTQMLE